MTYSPPTEYFVFSVLFPLEAHPKTFNTELNGRDYLMNLKINVRSLSSPYLLGGRPVARVGADHAPDQRSQVLRVVVQQQGVVSRCVVVVGVVVISLALKRKHPWGHVFKMQGPLDAVELSDKGGKHSVKYCWYVVRHPFDRDKTSNTCHHFAAVPNHPFTPGTKCPPPNSSFPESH